MLKICPSCSLENLGPKQSCQIKTFENYLTLVLNLMTLVYWACREEREMWHTKDILHWMKQSLSQFDFSTNQCLSITVFPEEQLILWHRMFTRSSIWELEAIRMIMFPEFIIWWFSLFRMSSDKCPDLLAGLLFTEGNFLTIVCLKLVNICMKIELCRDCACITDHFEFILVSLVTRVEN